MTVHTIPISALEVSTAHDVPSGQSSTRIPRTSQYPKQAVPEQTPWLQ